MDLTDKQDMFCREYLIDLNATQAAIRAGYSEKTANRIGPENLSKLVVQNRIQELKNERIERTNTEQDKTVDELKKVAFSDYLDIIDHVGGMVVGYKSIDEIPKNLRACIASVAPSPNGIQIKFHDKMKALDMLMRHEGKYKEDNSQSQVNTINIKIESSGVKLPTSEDEIEDI